MRVSLNFDSTFVKDSPSDTEQVNKELPVPDKARDVTCMLGAWKESGRGAGVGVGAGAETETESAHLSTVW